MSAILDDISIEVQILYELKEITKVLKIIQLHNEKITGEDFKEEDIEE